MLSTKELPDYFWRSCQQYVQPSEPFVLNLFPSMKKILSFIQSICFLLQRICVFLWCTFDIGVRQFLRYIWILFTCMWRLTVDLVIWNAKIFAISQTDFYWIETVRKISLSCRRDVFLGRYKYCFIIALVLFDKIS